MSHRDDILDVLSGRRSTGSVPIWELSFHGWDAISGQHLILGREFENLSQAQQERALHTNAEIILSVAEKLHFAAVTLPSGYWEQAPGQLAYYVLPGEARFEQIKVFARLAGGKFAIVGNSGGVLAADYSEDFCDALYNDPERIEEQARNYLEWGVQCASRLRDLGVEIVLSASDVADNSGPFFNPQQMQRFILPYLDRWALRCQQMGLRTILHSDGNLTGYLDAIAQTHVDALQAIDPVAGMDMRESFRIVGDRLCLCGNVDCGMLLRGTPEQVFAATRDLLVDCKHAGRLVLGASNAVQQEVPAENYLAMIEAWKQYGSMANGDDARGYAQQ